MRCPFASRRGLLAAAGGLLAAATAAAPRVAQGAKEAAAEPFWGEHQSGIITPPQHHSYFATLDLTTTKPSDVVALLGQRRALGGTVMIEDIAHGVVVLLPYGSAIELARRFP